MTHDDSVPALRMRGVTLSFAAQGRRVGQEVLRGVDLDLPPGEVVGLVGESGCGKSTLARVGVGLLRPDAGHVILRDGTDLAASSARAVARLRPRLQWVVQDPYSAFDPSLPLRRSIVPVVRRQGHATGDAARSLAADALVAVGLQASHLDRLPGQLSGGQLQRAALARALLVDPEVLIADEIVSALDFRVGEEILHLVRRGARERGRAVLFVSHDLGAVALVCDRIAVMDEGVIVESGPTGAVLNHPQHARTQALLEAVPTLP